jgi:hypothetical protein
MVRDKWNFVFASLPSFSGTNYRLELCIQLLGPNFWCDAGIYSRTVTKVVLCMFPQAALPCPCSKVTNTQMCTYLTYDVGQTGSEPY